MKLKSLLSRLILYILPTLAAKPTSLELAKGMNPKMKESKQIELENRLAKVAKEFGIKITTKKGSI